MSLALRSIFQLCATSTLLLACSTPASAAGRTAPLKIVIKTQDAWRLASSGVSATRLTKYYCYLDVLNHSHVGLTRRTSTALRFTEVSSPSRSQKKSFTKARKACAKIRWPRQTPVPTIAPTVPPGSTPTPPADCEVPAGFTAVTHTGQLLTGVPSNSNLFLCNDLTFDTPLSLPPLGDRFDGVLDGNGRRLSGFKLSSPHTMLVGLARTIGRNGIIRNLHIENADVRGGALVGIVAGINGGQVVDVTVTGSVNASAAIAGGIAGVNVSPGKLSGSSFSGVVSGPNTEPGQAVGLRN